MNNIVCNCGAEIKSGTLLQHMKDVHQVTGDTNSQVSRVVLIDHRKDGIGILEEVSDVDVDLDYQDAGRTLKVFLRDRK